MTRFRGVTRFLVIVLALITVLLIFSGTEGADTFTITNTPFSVSLNDPGTTAISHLGDGSRSSIDTHTFAPVEL